MTVATGTLAINAAFLQEIKDDNRQVHDLLAEAGELVHGALQHVVPARRLAEVLSDLRDQVAIHFSLEEAYGYFEDAIDTAPQLSERAEELRSQHGELFVKLCGVVEQAERWLYHEAERGALTELHNRFEKFRHEFREHETREATLIQEAFASDVGVGD